MSIRVDIEVHCDAPGCARYTKATARECCGHVMDDDIRFPVRPDGGGIGWTYDGKGARCPEHAEAKESAPET